VQLSPKNLIRTGLCIGAILSRIAAKYFQVPTDNGFYPKAEKEFEENMDSMIDLKELAESLL
jgi:hypothetical protein